jgi:DNA-binding LytR/AlgR family response regulator
MNILIIEDEPRTAKLLREFILAVDDTHTVLEICDSVESTVQFLATTTHRIDLLFMDIQLADGSSFDIFQKTAVTLFRPIDDIEAALDPQSFFRINRQMILNRDAILEMEPFFNRRVIVTLKILTAERPLVSRLKVTPFLEWVEKG